MKKYSAILFDMDGTLLPMDMKEFTNGYFLHLAKKLKPFGIQKEQLIPAIWDGTAAMVKNDGSVTNDKAFWKRFSEITGITGKEIEDTCLDYYSNEFNNAREYTQPNPYAKEAVLLAHEKSPIVALATNPLFPMAGQITRMSWVGLAPSDFDLVTNYESDSYCKPNPKYYISVCERLGVDPKECLLIGNDEEEDMYAGSSIGLDCYLVTDTMIASKEHPWQGPKGTFLEMMEMLRNL